MKVSGGIVFKPATRFTLLEYMMNWIKIQVIENPLKYYVDIISAK